METATINYDEVCRIIGKIVLNSEARISQLESQLIKLTQKDTNE